MTAPWDAEAAARERGRAQVLDLASRLESYCEPPRIAADAAAVMRAMCRTIDDLHARATAPSGAEAMREAAAKVCEVEASKWELKIETSPEPPEAKPNLMWAHMANEASDCAELIRALPLPASPPPALGDVSAEELKAVRGDIEHRLKFFIIPERRALLESFLSRIPAAGKDAEE
jgi:hypothetical protein